MVERLAPDAERRFWAGIDRSAGDSACWPRLRSEVFEIGPRRQRRYRALACELLTGKPSGRRSGWSCGNRLCCNPAHVVEPGAFRNRRDALARLATDSGLRSYVARTLHSRLDTAAGQDSCWPYVGNRSSAGYGFFSLCGKNELAHRISWVVAGGGAPGALFVCHRCDNPACCNPSHLFLGTAADNSRDRDQKGRAGFRAHPGEANGAAKLTASDAKAIYAAAGPLTGIAARFGVSAATVAKIKRGKAWRHVTRHLEPARLDAGIPSGQG